MKHIIEASDLPEQDKVYLRKGYFGYRVVHPIKNDNGSINWVNLLVGGWGNLVTLIFLAFVIGTFFYGIYDITHQLHNQTLTVCEFFPPTTNDKINSICGRNLTEKFVSVGFRDNNITHILGGINISN